MKTKQQPKTTFSKLQELKYSQLVELCNLYAIGINTGNGQITGIYSL